MPVPGTVWLQQLQATGLRHFNKSHPAVFSQKIMRLDGLTQWAGNGEPDHFTFQVPGEDFGSALSTVGQRKKDTVSVRTGAAHALLNSPADFRRRQGIFERIGSNEDFHAVK